MSEAELPECQFFPTIWERVPHLVGRTGDTLPRNVFLEHNAAVEGRRYAT